MPLWLPDRSPQLLETIAVTANPYPVTVTSGSTANTKGSWVQLISSTTADTYGLWLWVAGVAISAGDGRCLLDVGVGASGSERVILPNLNFGAASPTAGGWRRFMFIPIYIPKTSRVAVRCQRETASATCTMGWMLEEQPAWPGGAGSIGTDYGTSTSASRGTIVTTGKVAYGSWTQIVASTTSAHKWWWVGLDVGGDTNQNAGSAFIQIGAGPAGSETVIGTFIFNITAGEEVQGPFNTHPIYNPLPANTRIAVRGSSNSGNNFGVVVHALS